MREDFCVSYNPEKPPRDVLVALVNQLSNNFRYLDGRDDRRTALKSARYLFVVFTRTAEFESRVLRDDWAFFLDEIRWKRKAGGEVILLVPGNFDFSRVPVRLKNCAYFTFEELKDLNAYLLAKGEETEEKESGAMAVAKPIVYTPHKSDVKQIEFSLRAPSVPSFDGTVTPGAKKAESGCKDSHVFVAPKREAVTPTGSTKLSRQAQDGRKSSKKGCLVGGVVCAIFVIIFTVIVAVGIALK